MKGAKIMSNRNHPAKGSTIKVDPIRDLKAVKAIKRMLQDNPRDLCLFTLGINTNLRASDLLSIKAGQVRGEEELVLKEKKTSKERRITLNKAVRAVISELLDSREYSDQDLLFQGQRGPLTVPTVSRMVKQWCRMVNLKGNYAAHSLRKTFGYHQRVTFGAGLPELMVTFNHSSQKQTLDYLCIQPEEVRDLYLNEL